MVDWNSVLSQVVQAVLAIVIPALGIFVAAALKSWKEKMEAQARSYAPDAYDLLKAFAKDAVQAAEQNGLFKIGKEKKEYAIQTVEHFLAMHNIIVDLDLIDAAVESAVLEEFGKK